VLKSLLSVPLLLVLITSSLGAWAKGKAHPFRQFDNTPNQNNQNVWTFSLESDTYRDTDYISLMVDFSSEDCWDIQFASYNIPYYGGLWCIYIRRPNKNASTLSLGSQHRQPGIGYPCRLLFESVNVKLTS